MDGAPLTWAAVAFPGDPTKAALSLGSVSRCECCLPLGCLILHISAKAAWEVCFQCRVRLPSPGEQKQEGEPFCWRRGPSASGSSSAPFLVPALHGGFCGAAWHGPWRENPFGSPSLLLQPALVPRGARITRVCSAASFQGCAARRPWSSRKRPRTRGSFPSSGTAWQPGSTLPPGCRSSAHSREGRSWYRWESPAQAR